MNRTEDLSSGVSGKKARQAPGLRIYILEGSLEYQVEGHPPRMCNVGEALIVPAGAGRAVRNVCSGNAAELDTYLVGKGEAGHRRDRVSAVSAADCRSGFGTLEGTRIMSIDTAMNVDPAVRPFHVGFAEEAVADLRRRIAAWRPPEREPVDDQSQGVQLATVQDLANYWATEYDWRGCEAKLNALP